MNVTRPFEPELARQLLPLGALRTVAGDDGAGAARRERAQQDVDALVADVPSREQHERVGPPLAPRPPPAVQAAGSIPNGITRTRSWYGASTCACRASAGDDTMIRRARP